MNDQLRQFARQTIREGLERLGDRPNLLFRRMYGRGVGGLGNDMIAALDINAVLDGMTDNQLETAMNQVLRTLAARTRSARWTKSDEQNPA